LEQTLIATGSIKRAMFQSHDVFIFNAGVQIFLWVGRGASNEERKSGMRYAIDYLVENKLPATTPIRYVPYDFSRILEGGENQKFLSFLEC
jgi:hypothetical protein